jgi:hypothetical protein
MAAALSPGSIRKAGGRPKESRNKRSLELIQRAEAKGISPLDLMLEVMHDLWHEGDRLAAFACAERIAPYLHARLAAVEQKVETQVRQTVVNGEPLSIEEFDLKYGVKRDKAPQPN